MAIHPVSVKNSFGSHFILWSLFLPLLALILVPVFMPEQRIDEAEIAMVSTFSINVVDMTDATNATFSKAFLDTGVMPATEKWFSGQGAGEFQKNSKYAASWIHGVWLMIYKAMWRVNVLTSIFFMPLLALLIPAAVDGFAVRARKKYRFENSNPVFFYSSMHMVVLMFGLFAFLPLAPITLSSNALFGLLACLTLGVWMTASNFQTGT